MAGSYRLRDLTRTCSKQANATNTAFRFQAQKLCIQLFL